MRAIKGLAVILLVFFSFAVFTSCTEVAICSDCGERHAQFDWVTFENYELNYELPSASRPSNYFDILALSAADYYLALPHFTISTNVYTEDFGGSYIDSNGYHHICTVGNRRPIESQYLIYNEVKYSLNYLRSSLAKIDELMDNQELGITEAGINNYSNLVYVKLDNACAIHLVVDEMRSAGLYKKGAIIFCI